MFTMHTHLGTTLPIIYYLTAGIIELVPFRRFTNWMATQMYGHDDTEVKFVQQNSAQLTSRHAYRGNQVSIHMQECNIVPIYAALWCDWNCIVLYLAPSEKVDIICIMYLTHLM